MYSNVDEYEVFNLRIIHRKTRTGFEENKDLAILLNTIIKMIKDFFDQSLDEIKLLKPVNKYDPGDEHHILRLYDYFYHQEHLFIVCEFLRANLYELQKFNQESGGEAYFTLSRLQVITRQCLEALDYLHDLGIIHCDLKPENILIKVIEDVLFPNDAVVRILARMVGMLGPINLEMLENGQETYKYFRKEYDLYHINEETNQFEYIISEESSLEHHLQVSDVVFIDFVRHLFQMNPQRRPTARDALEHPWLSYSY
ncbi:hypothetical protein CRYUN_Cryun01aG0029200 [Craigia yunnanensis]